MHYNPFSYIHSEKDILKLVTTLIANTKGEGKAGDDFWVKAETLLYCALIGYIHYEAPVEEQNFSTLIEFINAMEVREDDEEFKNPVDLMFDALEAEKPNHFAVRQYKKYKLAAGKTAKSMFDSVNQQVADIATQVGQTPQGWNGSIFSMIQNLSNSIMVPIAGVILAIVMTLELIQMITDKNNLPVPR